VPVGVEHHAGLGRSARPQQLRQSGTAKPADNVFTPAELERVLRQFDADASTLPPRLAALLDDYAQRSRMTITTDSWDAPVISGTAMVEIRDALRALLIVGVMGGLTTYSALMLELMAFSRGGHPERALGYLALTLVGGLALVWLGLRAGEALRGPLPPALG
jgi:hypothetical protein